MSDLLGIGYSGLKAYSRALSTIGDNIANAQTPGYARRRLEMMEAVGGGNSVFYRGNTNPGGVDIRGIDRSVDGWLIEDSRITSGDAERSATRLGWLSKTEDALSDETNGIKTGLTRLYTTADQLTSDPANRTLRSAVPAIGDDIASGFRTAAGQLDKMGEGIEGAAASEVDQFNADLTALEQINIGLRKSRPGSTNEASLLDERDRLLDKISSQAGVSTTFDNNGAVTLRAAGSGDLLVGGGVVNPITVTAAADGRLSYSVGGTPLAISTGSLAGLAEGANHVADQRAALDTMATQFAAQLNAAHQAGTDANGNPGQPLFTGASAATLTVAPLTPDQVAAAECDGQQRQYARARRDARSERSRIALVGAPCFAGADGGVGARAGCRRCNARRRVGGRARFGERSRSRQGSRRAVAVPASLCRRSAHDPGRARNHANAAQLVVRRPKP
jgi:flagellar hook-associated protein 1 FlgK